MLAEKKTEIDNRLQITKSSHHPLTREEERKKFDIFAANRRICVERKLTSE